MLISETRIRNLVKGALLEAASQEEIDKRAIELKKEIEGLSDAQARLLAKEELKGSESESEAEQKGFGEWDEAGGNAFRGWMRDNYENAAEDFDLDREGSHTNKFIKNAYRGKFTDDEGNETSYGNAWLASIKAGKESERQEASGGGDISSEENFFKQRALNYQSFLKEEGDSESNRADVQDESISSFFYGGMPLRYVYHYNEFGRGGARPKKFKAVNPSVIEDLETVGIDVAAVKALNGRPGKFKYKKNDNAFSIAYSPRTKTLYFSSDDPEGGEAGTRNFKMMNVPYVNGVLKMDEAEVSEEGETSSLEDSKSQWDNAQSQATAAYKKLYNDLKGHLKTPVKEMNARWDTVEWKVMLGLGKCDKAINEYHKELLGYAKSRVAATEKLPEEMKPKSGNTGYDDDKTPWGSGFTGMWAGYYAFKAAMDYHDAPAGSADAMVEWFDGALSGSDYKKMKKYIETTWYKDWMDMSPL